MSLKEPHRKMSKSHADPRSRILITDSPDDIHHKIKQALTDSRFNVSYDPVDRPGVSNLLDIWSHLDDKQRSAVEIAGELGDMSMRMFKERLATIIANHFSGIRDRYAHLMGGPDTGSLRDIATVGASQARASADATLSKVKNKVGF